MSTKLITHNGNAVVAPNGKLLTIDNDNPGGGGGFTPDYKDGDDVTVSGRTVTIPAGTYASPVTKQVAQGTAGTPTATKGAVVNHAVTVTPSVTNGEGYINGETKDGDPVTVTADELTDGTLELSANTAGDGADCTTYKKVKVNVQGTGGGTAPVLADADPVSPTLEEQTFTPGAGVDGFRSYKVAPVTAELLADLDENFVAENIADGVEIFGVTGERDSAPAWLTYMLRLGGIFTGATHLPESITMNVPMVTEINSTFSGVTTGLKKIYLTTGAIKGIAYMLGPSSSPPTSSVTELHLTCTFDESGVNFNNAFKNANRLEVLDVNNLDAANELDNGIDFTNATGVTDMFNLATYIQTVRFRANSLSLTLGIMSLDLTDESLVSIANGLHKGTTGQKLSLSNQEPHSDRPLAGELPPRRRIQNIIGTVDEYGVFTLDEDGTITLEEFITGEEFKGWTLNELTA